MREPVRAGERCDQSRAAGCRSRRSMSLATVRSRSTLCVTWRAWIAMSWCGSSIPMGRADQLNCNQLDIHFAPKAAAPNAKAEPVVVDPSKRQQRDLGRLEPAAIIALGHPAIAISPATKSGGSRRPHSNCTCASSGCGSKAGTTRRLTSGPNVLQAPMIDYQQPEQDSATQIGRFRATGPGSLHFVADPSEAGSGFSSGLADIGSAWPRQRVSR